MENDEPLAAFQAALLELLHQDLPAAEILRRLQSEAVFEPFRSYLATFDLRAVEVAGELVQKWGRVAEGHRIRPGAE